MMRGLFLTFAALAMVLPAARAPAADATPRVITLTLDDKSLPRSPGYHELRGRLQIGEEHRGFAYGLFLPRSYFSSTEAMPVVVTLHNGGRTGEDGGDKITSEGLGLLIGRDDGQPTSGHRIEGNHFHVPLFVRPRVVASFIMAKDLAIILNNGSINSAVVTALAAQKHRVVMLYADVGGMPGPRARQAYEQQLAHFKPYREHTMPMPWLSVVEPSEELAAAASDPRHPTPIAPQMTDLLPLVASALRFAVHYQAGSVYLGLRLGNDADKLAQAMEYGQIWNEMMQLPCNQPELMVEMPLLELEPWQVIDLGFQGSAPFEKTWTCTQAGSEPCWACRACRGREAAFQQAAKPDPLRVVRKV